MGNIYVSDPEADPVTYRLVQAPQYGTAEIATDGTWTYTPNADYTGSDHFTVAVANPGFNLLDPFNDRVTEFSVGVGDPAPQSGSAATSYSFTRSFDIVNVTPSSLGLYFVGGIGDRGQIVYPVYDAILAAPPTGTVLKPGDTAHFEIGGTLLDGIPDVSALFADPTDVYRQWWSIMKGNRVGLSYLTYIDNASNPLPAYTSGYTYGLAEGDSSTNAKAALVPVNLTTALTSTDQGAQDLLTWFLANSTPQTMTNVQFDPNPPGDPGYTRQVSVDNTGDAPGSINKTVSASTSTTKGSSWEVSGKVSWSPIEKILGLEVAGKYGKSESETNTKTFTTTVTSTSLPWSANEILTAPPKLLVTGDAEFVVGSGDRARTYSFTGVQYYFPSQTLDAPLYLIKTEPLQPKYTAADNVDSSLIGTPIPNVGFTVRDKDSKFLSPTYSVGQKAQLTVQAYQGVGAAADKTGDPRTIYSTSNAAVATVDKTGALTAVGPGTATITARYDWSIPYGGGSARKDYVLATLNVTVV